MTRLALAGNIGALGASGSAKALGASSAIISCNIPGSSMEALASERIAVRREGLNGFSIWWCFLWLVYKHKFIGCEHCTDEFIQRFFPGICGGKPVGGIGVRCGSQKTRTSFDLRRC